MRSGQRKGQNYKTRRAHHGLDADEVANVVCVAVIHDCAHASVDDCLEVRERSTHPVAGQGESVVHVVVGHSPCTLRANFRRHCCAVEICCKLGRVWVRICCGHVIYVIVS